VNRAAVPEDDRAQTLGTLIAALTPLLAMLAVVSAFPPVAGGDSAIAAALELELTAPPGHPLAALAGRLCTLLPLGPLALRVGLCSALLSAVAAAALYRALDRSLRVHAAVRALYASPLALGLTLFVFGCEPLFAAEPRAHMAAVALGCLCLERIVAFECAWPRLELATLRAAGLWWALLVAEQPALAAAVLVAALPSLRRLLSGYRLPLANLAPLALGLPLWLYGVLARGSPLGLPAGSLASRLGAAFAPASATAAWPPAPEPVGPDPVWLTALVVLFVVIGLRARALRRIGLPWLWLALSALLGASVLERAAALHALALCACAALATLACGAPLAGSSRSRLAVALALLSVALGVTQLQATARAARMHDPGSADVLGDALRRTLPARSALLLGDALARAQRDAESLERVRPDLLFALKPWLLPLEAAQRVAARNRELLPLLRAELLDSARQAASSNAPPLFELAALAARRPVLIELAPGHERALHPSLLPFGPYHQVSTSSVGKADFLFAERESEQRWSRLYAALGPSQLDAATVQLLAERHAAQADYAHSLADPELAQHAFAHLARLPLTPAAQRQLEALVKSRPPDTPRP